MKIAISALLGSSLLLMSGAVLAQVGGNAGAQAGTSGGYSYGGTYGPAMPSSSSDDNIGLESQIVFGVERTMGLFFVHDKLERTAGNVTATRTTDTNTIALFGNTGPVPATIPRLALDYFVIDGFSLGASFVYWRTGGTITNEATGTPSRETDPGTAWTLVVHPRLGYSFIFDETFALWARGGITYSSANLTTEFPADPASGTPAREAAVKSSAFDISLDVPLVISPIENFAILIGPFVDIGLSGSAEEPVINPVTGALEQQESDHTLTDFGLSVGVSAYY
jgi:hypothetical protein